ncbi:Phosphoglycolate phosphatase [bioreactor metagenome]|uniref:Phosphoglycolate phosphatase n=1 Tax=bioreactor metagenome TaxID=1076179 RepID=A0A645JEP9_9ZZZZ
MTNKPTPFVAPLLEALDIAKYFSVVIGGDDVQNKKPHPDPLLLVASKLGIKPEQMLLVGDSRNDIQAAKAAGCPSVGLTYGYNYGESIALSQPDVIYDRINELLPALGLPHSENQESKND